MKIRIWTGEMWHQRCILNKRRVWVEKGPTLSMICSCPCSCGIGCLGSLEASAKCVGEQGKAIASAVCYFKIKREAWREREHI